MFSIKDKLNLAVSLPVLSNTNQIQQVKASGNQPRFASQSPNVLAQASALTLPSHVSEVRAIATKASDATTKVVLTFSRNPNDYFFVDSRIFVSGYKGNPAPVQVASGQSPVSFSLENTGEPVTVTVQASGNLGQAPLSTAPTTTLQLVKTNLATVSTPGGNGPASNPLLLKTNGLTNSSQTVLNLESVDESLYLTDQGGGSIDFAHKVFYTSFLYPQFNAGNYVESPNTSLSFGSGGIGSPTVVVVGASASLPAYIKHTTPASSGNAVCVYGTGNRLRLDIVKSAKLRIKIFETTSVRNWHGMSDSALPQGGNFQSDTPSQNIVGFRFSTGAGDTNWQAVCQTDATHQTVVDTGVAPDINAFHVYEVRTVAGTPGTVLFYIDHALVASISTNVPTSSQALNPLVYTETRTGATRSVGVTVLSFEHHS